MTVERGQPAPGADSEGGARQRLRRFVARQARLLLVSAVALAFLLGLYLGRGSAPGGGGIPGHVHESDASEAHGEAQSAGQWTCSMHPQIRAAEPGACPLCGMDLIPLDEAGDSTAGEAPTRVTLTPRAKAMAKITTAAVRRVDAETVELRLLGRVEYDERRLRTVTSWTDGRIDQLKVAVTGQRIRRGQAIATLYSPEVYSAHQDLIQAARQARRLGEGTATARTAAAAAFEATRQRLRLLGVPDSELGAMERADRPFRHVSIRANVAGTVIERLVDEGDYVTPGTGLYRVADLSKLWVQLDAYERDLAFVSRGQQVSLVISAFPRETFEGAIAFIDPVLDRRTRTSQIRVDVDNRDGRLQPGMFAEATISAGSGQRGLQSLVIPESAPLFTGRRSVVYVEVPGREEPTYEARQVRLGHRMGDVFPVVAGLSEGERVVVHGAFALDADLQIRGGRSMMAQPDDGEAGDHDLVVPVDRDFASSLAPLVGAYLSIQERLGEDDFPAAVAATRALAREVSQFSEPREREAREVWATLAEGFRRHAGQGAQAGDIEAARLVFEQLSLLMVSLLERFGNPLSTPLRLAYCPMVRQNQGASWVQRGQEVDNSYFGASMRRCGEIRATVAPGQHLLPQGGARGGEHQR